MTGFRKKKNTMQAQMKKLIAIFSLLLLLANQSVSAQTDSGTKTVPQYKIGIFAPLYLDSVFNNNTFRYSKGIPRFIMPSLDFIQGAQIALDSLPAGDETVTAYIYDSKAYKQTIPWLIQNNKLDSLQLLIGHVKDAEYRQLADFALQKKIPFISATYPNDGGITANPYLVIVNSTLKAHCDALYTFLLQNHGTDKIYLCRKKGTKEDMIISFLQQANEQDGRALLDMKILNFETAITADSLKRNLDSNRKNIIIGCSLDENFAATLAQACFKSYKTYPISLFGMPNWDGFQAFFKKDNFTDFPIYITTPYYNTKLNEGSRFVTNAYSKKYKGKPSDMAFKGFESIAYFLPLLKKDPASLTGNLNEKPLSAICEYNFRPVMLKKENATPDYFENKHLYFIKILNGAITKSW